MGTTLSTLPSPEPSPLPTPPSISPGSAAMLTRTLKASLGPSAPQAGAVVLGFDPPVTSLELASGLVGDGEDDLSSLGSLGQSSRQASTSVSRGSVVSNEAAVAASVDAELKLALEGVWRMYKRQGGSPAEAAANRFIQVATAVTKH
jgi:hypothetical protein